MLQKESRVEEEGRMYVTEWSPSNHRKELPSSRGETLLPICNMIVSQALQLLLHLFLVPVKVQWPPAQ